MIARKVTKKFLDRVDEGYYNLEQVIRSFCVYLSEDEIKDFVIAEEYMDPSEVNDERDG